jgi:hypothetical protein
MRINLACPFLSNVRTSSKEDWSLPDRFQGALESQGNLSGFEDNSECGVQTFLSIFSHFLRLCFIISGILRIYTDLRSAFVEKSVVENLVILGKKNYV